LIKHQIVKTSFKMKPPMKRIMQSVYPTVHV